MGYNKALIEDSCAVSAQMGQGSLFITMTCNPHWPEITAALEPGQSWEDRPDVVNRVFKIKLQELLEDLRQGKLYKRQDGTPWKTKYIMYYGVVQIIKEIRKMVYRRRSYKSSKVRMIRPIHVN